MEAGELRFRAMGSEVHVVVAPRWLATVARDRIEDLERRWSRFLPDSEVTRLNRTAGRWMAVSAETNLLLRRALEGWRWTGGTFDPTVLPAVVAAGHTHSREDGAEAPPVSAAAGPAPGCGGVEVENGRAALPPGVAFDPGGVGKGLAADLVAEELLCAGARYAVVSIGGDLRAAGDLPEGGVTVEVEDPVDPNRIVLVLGVAGGGVATSAPGARVAAGSHLIDPRTGSPVGDEILQATVLAGEAWRAEVACKALVVGGAVAGIEWLEAWGLDGLVVLGDGGILATRGLRRFAA